MLQYRDFFALAPRSGFRAAISHAVARSSIVFCNSISRYRIVMAASRLLGAAAACVILLSFAAGHRESYWIDCIRFATVICHWIFSDLALMIFLLKLLLKSCNYHGGCAYSSIWCNSISRYRIVMAASRLLGAAVAACVILLSFAAESRESYWSGCIKVARVICH